MSRLLKKLAPTMVLLGAVAWCANPHFLQRGLPLIDLGGSQHSRFEHRTLHPDIRAPSGRDPFSTVQEIVLPGSLPPDTPLFGQEPAPGPAPPSPQKLLRTLRLGGTCIVGDQHLAVINDHVYSAGESIPLAAASDLTCVLTEVLPDKVVVQIGQRIWRLSYPDPTRDEPPSGGVDDSPLAEEHDIEPFSLPLVEDRWPQNMRRMLEYSKNLIAEQEAGFGGLLQSHEAARLLQEFTRTLGAERSPPRPNRTP